MRITIANTKEALFLFLGDIFFFAVALWLTLLARRAEIPTLEFFYTHLTPFAILFAAWFVVFFIAGLYDKHTTLFKKKLPNTIFNAQVINVILAAIFFFLVPFFGITPKTILVIYLFVFFVLILLWRLTIFPFFVSRVGNGKRQKAVLMSSGIEAEELYEEVNSNNRYPFEFILHIDPSSKADAFEIEGKLLSCISSGEASVIVGDSDDKRLESLVPLVSNLAFLESQFRFIDVQTLYENIFDKIPLSLIHSKWFLENISAAPRRVYTFLKRIMDIVAGAILSIITLVLIPFVALAIKLDDDDGLFFVSERVGKDNKVIQMYKFRSMSTTEREKITRVGAFLRKTRLDEFPQAWNLLKGDISLIGPRAEIPTLVKQYAERIPNYNVRHTIKPGLSGWAQINDYNAPKGARVEIDKTKSKLSYDLYYLKNRSVMLDIHIALKTLKTLLSRSGV